MPSERRSTLTLMAFAAPCLPLAAFGLPLVVVIPTYYAQTLGVPVALVGLMLMLVRFIDIGFDPVFGTVLDRTRWRFGRFKSWFAIGTPILMVGTWMLFMAERGVGPFYLWAWLLVVYIGFSITVLSHTSWAATLSSDYHQRSRIYTFWQAGNVIGMILILALPLLLTGLQLIGRNDPAGSVQAQGLTIIIALPLMIGLALWRVDEPKRAEGAAHATLGDYFRLLKRPTVVRILTADLLMGWAPGIAGALFYYFFQQTKGFTYGQASQLLMVYFIAAIAGSVIWAKLSRRIGKSKTMIVASVTYALVQFGVVMLPAGNFMLAIPFLIAAGLPYSAAPTLLRAMMADYSDEERLATGADRTGLLYAILTGTVKIGSALAGTSLILLGALGFNAEHAAQSTAASMTGLQLLYAFGPGVIGLIAAAVMFGYPLTEARHREILRQLGEKDAAGPVPVPEDVAVLNVVSPKPAE